MIDTYFSKNIGDEIISLYSEIVNDYGNRKNIALKSIVNSFYNIDKKKNVEISNKNMYDYILNEMNNNGKMKLLEISNRLKKCLNNIYLPNLELKKDCFNKLNIVRKIMRFEEISDIKLNSIKIILSSIIHSILSFYIIEVLKNEIEFHNKFIKYNDKTIDECINIYYEIEHIMINQILSKLLSLYFLSNSLYGGSKFILENDVINKIKYIYMVNKERYNTYENRLFYKSIFKDLSNNIITELKGGTKIEDLLKELKDKNIPINKILENPDFLISLNMALGEIEMPKLKKTKELDKIETEDGYDVLNVIFGNKASGSVMKIFNKYNDMNANKLVDTLNEYKENINNGKEIENKNNIKSISNFKNSFNFTDKDIEIIYTLNLIDALKILGNTPLYDENNKKPIDKNITVNFNCPVVETKIDGIEIKNKKSTL